MKTTTILAILVLAFGLATEVAKADFTFGTPKNLGPTVNSSSGEVADCFSSDGLELYFTSDRPGGSGSYDIWVTTRETINDEWGTPINLGPVINTRQEDAGPCISADGLELYFCSNRAGGSGDWDTWVTMRETVNDEWGMPVNLGPPVNTSGQEHAPRLSTDGLELYFSSWGRPGGYGAADLWVTRRATLNDPWGSPINLGPVINSSADENMPFISANGLSLFFSEDYGGPYRPGGFGDIDMWVTTRASVNDPWETPLNLGPIVNSASLDCGALISPDGSMLYFCSERPGGFGGTWGDIYQARVIPIVDLNGDGIVDCADICTMVDYWGTDESLCDIGPTPLGDGIVDTQDLIVLAEHLFEDMNDPTLIAHWPLDETGGDIAYDSAADYDGILINEPAWQPDGGMVAGALQFDGVDDYVSTDPVLNPADGPFSVFAWIQGGVPGQVVISQTGLGGANWLLADPSEGNLMTELKGSGRGAAALLSQTVVTDGQWYRIGIVRNGSNRTLYVDDVEVASDTQDDLEPAIGGLYIGAGKGLESGSFFSGLIDDVRIYNRAVMP